MQHLILFVFTVFQFLLVITTPSQNQSVLGQHEKALEQIKNGNFEEASQTYLAALTMLDQVDVLLDSTGRAELYYTSYDYLNLLVALADYSGARELIEKISTTLSPTDPRERSMLDLIQARYYLFIREEDQAKASLFPLSKYSPLLCPEVSWVASLYYHRTEQPDSAVFYAKQGLDCVEEGDIEIEMRLEQRLGYTYSGERRFDEVSQVLEQVQRKIGMYKYEAHYIQISQWSAYADLLLREYKNDSSIFYYNKVLERIRQDYPINHPLKWSTLGSIGYNYQFLGDPIRAKEYLLQALNGNKSQEVVNYVDLGFYHLKLGEINTQMGHYPKAKTHYQQAYQIFKEHMGEEHLYTASAISSLGGVFDNLGNVDQAFNYEMKSLQIVLSNPKSSPQYQSGSYQRLALLYQQKKEFSKADSLMRKAIHLLSQENLTYDLSGAYHNYGINWFHLENWDSARYYFNKSLNMDLKYFGPDNVVLSSSTIMLGRTTFKQGNYDEAIQTFLKGLRLEEREYGLYNAQVSLTRVYLAIAYYKKNQYDSALYYYQSALKCFDIDYPVDSPVAPPDIRKSGLGYDLEVILEWKARLFQDWSEDVIDREPLLQNALTVYHQLQDVNDSSKTLLSSYTASVDYLSTQDWIDNAMETCMDIYEITNSEDYLSDAFYFIEKGKSSLLLEALITQQANQFAGLSTEILALEQELKTDLLYLQQQIQEIENKEEMDLGRLVEWRGIRYQKQQQYDSLLDHLKRNNPAYHQLKYNHDVVTLDHLQNLLEEDQVFIDYLWTDSILYAMAVTREEATFQQVAESEDLKAIKEYLFYLTHKINRLEDGNLAFELYQTILDGLLSSLSGDNIHHLIISPDGQLGYLPFESLTVKDYSDDTPEDFRYLLEQYEISYANSATVWERNRNIDTYADQNYLGFAPEYQNLVALNTDPTIEKYELSRGALQPLAGAAEEVGAALRLLGGISFTQSEATEAQFKNNTTQPAITHLAMHAFADDVNPMQSKLIFTIGTDTLEDGMLNAYELFNMRIETQLAVLSACETGYGQLQNGEGVISLARGFMYAGCPSVVMSLWKANDYSTNLIMQEFFKGLKEGKSKSEALRDAKLNYLRTAPKRLQHPFYWSTFVLIGNDQPVIFTSDPVYKSYWFWMVISLLLVAFVVIKRNKRIHLTK